MLCRFQMMPTAYCFAQVSHTTHGPHENICHHSRSSCAVPLPNDAHCLLLCPGTMHCSRGKLKHLHNVEMHCYCPQMFLSLNFQCRDDVSEFKLAVLGLKRAIYHVQVYVITAGLIALSCSILLAVWLCWRLGRSCHVNVIKMVQKPGHIACALLTCLLTPACPHPTSPYHTSPRIASPHLSLPRLTSPRL